MGIHGVDADEQLTLSNQKILLELITNSDRMVYF